MERVDLLSDFRKEIEVLELTDEYMIYALDQKNELKDICSLERIYFADHRIERLLSLDYTRLWESLRTYGQMPDFFYAVNVLADYRVRLRKISKITWEIETDFVICPEGEILNIYPLNKDYMLMTDEVKSSDAVMNRFGLADEGHRYVNVVYLYEISTAKKYPVTDPRFYSRSEDWPVIRSDDGPVWICGYYDQEEVRDFGGSALFYIAVDRLIEDIKGCGRAQLIPVLAAGEDSFVRLIGAGNGRVILRQRLVPEKTEQIFSWDGHCLTPGAVYEVPDDMELAYDVSPDFSQAAVYAYTQDADRDTKQVRCLTKPMAPVAYDGKYGMFSKLYEGELLVTTYYDVVFVKEYEYHEFTALHDLVTGEVTTFEGRTAASENRLVMLRSFLAL